MDVPILLSADHFHLGPSQLGAAFDQDSHVHPCASFRVYVLCFVPKDLRHKDTDSRYLNLILAIKQKKKKKDWVSIKIILLP